MSACLIVLLIIYNACLPACTQLPPKNHSYTLFTLQAQVSQTT